MIAFRGNMRLISELIVRFISFTKGGPPFLNVIFMMKEGISNE